MDDLLDLFDRDERKRNGKRSTGRGLRGLLNRLTDQDTDRRDRYRDDDDDLPPTSGRRRRRRDDDHDLFDL